ncbi:STAS/SEC14 domain-containing protein [Aequorivita sp. CIP111184]|uniref:STAS/SEC14 domain-containing protein n=1 Tax=Aequorivita sp. CIP111184 TaxID=2211356 RepID=UPI000DBBE6B3|nr:STAS/SEC14 domain-containing protein [Aequorivita sp. CIP111184]SRX55054.1 hypothetical protein AEQU1_02075 [Aequorivita sp. CIP111184]
MIAKEKLTIQDCNKALSFLKSKIEEGFDTSLYLELNEFEGAKLLQEIKFKFKENIKKIAIVSRDESIEDMQKTAIRFYRTEIKFFKILEKKQAKKWISKLQL